MSGILAGLTIFQWAMITLAALIVSPMVWDKFKSWTSKPEVESPPKHDCESLIDVIKCWEHLKSCCEAKGLTEAAEEVHKVFPLFAKSKDTL